MSDEGSRLGPLLFIIYINAITTNIKSDILIFADDTSLHWSNIWKVTFNANKSKQILFSNKTYNFLYLIKLNNKTVKQVNTHEHLGIHLTSLVFQYYYRRANDSTRMIQ